MNESVCRQEDVSSGLVIENQNLSKDIPNEPRRLVIENFQKDINGLVDIPSLIGREWNDVKDIQQKVGSKEFIPQGLDFLKPISVKKGNGNWYRQELAQEPIYQGNPEFMVQNDKKDLEDTKSTYQRYHYTPKYKSNSSFLDNFEIPIWKKHEDYFGNEKRKKLAKEQQDESKKFRYAKLSKNKEEISQKSSKKDANEKLDDASEKYKDFDKYIEKINKKIKKQSKDNDDEKVAAINASVGHDGQVNLKLQCLICLGTVYQPRYCKNCETALFCSSCCDQLNKKCCLCKKATKFKKPNRINIQFLEEIKVKCVHEHCGLSNKTMTYQELCSSHLEKCAVYQIKCPMKCGETLLSKTHAEKHHKICPMHLKQCEVCSLIGSGLEQNDHDCLQRVSQQRDKYSQNLQMILDQQEQFEKQNEDLKNELEYLKVAQCIEKAQLKYQEVNDLIEAQYLRKAEQAKAEQEKNAPKKLFDIFRTQKSSEQVEQIKMEEDSICKAENSGTKNEISGEDYKS